MFRHLYLFTDIFFLRYNDLLYCSISYLEIWTVAKQISPAHLGWAGTMDEKEE